MSFVKFRQRYVKFRQNAFSVCKKYTQKRDEIIQIHRKTRKKTAISSRNRAFSVEKTFFNGKKLILAANCKNYNSKTKGKTISHHKDKVHNREQTDILLPPDLPINLY